MSTGEKCPNCNFEHGYQPMHGPFECINKTCKFFNAEHLKKHETWCKKKGLPLEEETDPWKETTEPGIGPHDQMLLDFMNSFSDLAASTPLDSIGWFRDPKVSAASKLYAVSLCLEANLISPTDAISLLSL